MHDCFRLVSTSVHVLGPEVHMQLSNEESDSLEQYLSVTLGTEPSDFTSHQRFARAFINGNIYHSTSYLRATKQNSHTIAYCVDSEVMFGQVKYFISVRSPFIDDPVTICAVEQFDVDKTMFLNQISSSSSSQNETNESYLQEIFHTITETKAIQFIKAEDIMSTCIKISIALNKYVIVKFPNRFDFIN